MSFANANTSTFNMNHEMTLASLHLRTMQRTKQTLTPSLLPSASAANIIVDHDDDSVQQPPEQMSRSIGAINNIPQSLSRRCHSQEHGTNVQQQQQRPRLKRKDLIRLMDEALSISNAELCIIPQEEEEEKKKAKVFVTHVAHSYHNHHAGTTDMQCDEDM